MALAISLLDVLQSAASVSHHLARTLAPILSIDSCSALLYNGGDSVLCMSKSYLEFPTRTCQCGMVVEFSRSTGIDPGIVENLAMDLY